MSTKPQGSNDQDDLFPFDSSTEGLPPAVLRYITIGRKSSKKVLKGGFPPLGTVHAQMLDVLIRVDCLASLDDVAIGAFRLHAVIFKNRMDLYNHMGKLMRDGFVEVEFSKRKKFYKVSEKYKTYLQAKETK